MATIKEVAELADVSTATVSRVINGHSGVKKANKENVIKAMKALDFKPNASAQALASNRTNSIGMLVGSFDGPFYGPLMHHVELEVRKHNMHLIVTSGQNCLQKEQDAIDFLLSKQVDGLIIDSDNLSDEMLIKLCGKYPNMVLINRYIPEIETCCSYLDNIKGGEIATSFLLEKGHKNIGCITGQLTKSDSRDRLQGYKNALNANNINYQDNYIIEGRFDHQGNAEVVRRLLDRANDLTAIFCQNDNIALAVYDECDRRNIRIGKDISIVGFDNDTHSKHIRPRLTTIDYPFQQMATYAAQAVLAKINGLNYDWPSNQIPKIIVRDSVCSI